MARVKMKPKGKYKRPTRPADEPAPAGESSNQPTDASTSSVDVNVDQATPAAGSDITQANTPASGDNLMNTTAPASGDNVMNTTAPASGDIVMNTTTPASGNNVINTATTPAADGVAIPSMDQLSVQETAQNVDDPMALDPHPPANEQSKNWSEETEAAAQRGGPLQTAFGNAASTTQASMPAQSQAHGSNHAESSASGAQGSNTSTAPARLSRGAVRREWVEAGSQPCTIVVDFAGHNFGPCGKSHIPERHDQATEAVSKAVKQQHDNYRQLTGQSASDSVAEHFRRVARRGLGLPEVDPNRQTQPAEQSAQSASANRPDVSSSGPRQRQDRSRSPRSDNRPARTRTPPLGGRRRPIRLRCEHCGNYHSGECRYFCYRCNVRGHTDDRCPTLQRDGTASSSAPAPARSRASAPAEILPTQQQADMAHILRVFDVFTGAASTVRGERAQRAAPGAPARPANFAQAAAAPASASTGPPRAGQQTSIPVRPASNVANPQRASNARNTASQGATSAASSSNAKDQQKKP